jgi:hypothetical protein
VHVAGMRDTKCKQNFFLETPDVDGRIILNIYSV